ncbi:hypothetical protein LI90_4362 (plasmid) [Carbonactinospora thermoautotrophica]|uniref:Phage tail protein n=1 Tax=Carbonactinospora thermoautotrophica TaxID=1469144 RepID=A0A132MHQ3_9ACTN|nr:hypothetical protein LI90_4362 [Carbonactinospora thermoautotrophica]
MTTERWYGRLPEFYRDADAQEQSGDGYPLLRYLSLLGDQAGEVETVLDRAAAGELSDPQRADPAWLPWLGQLVGVRMPPATTVQAWRDAIEDGASGWRSGTREAIAAAARTVLTGTRYVDVRPHEGKTTGGNPWVIAIVVRADEAPAPLSKVADAVVSAGAKPAGFALAVTTFVPTWDAVDTAYPTWQAIDALATWAQVDSTGAS